MMNSNSNSQAIDGRKKRATSTGKKKGSTAMARKGEVHMKTRGSIKKKASMKSMNVKKKAVLDRYLRLLELVMLLLMPFQGQLLIQKMLQVQLHSLFL
jgi:hypothetical protein